jgi:hypothetical protein
MIAVRMRAPALLRSTVVTAAVTVTSTLLLAAPARAVDEDVKVSITQLPGEFEAGADARTVAAVASTEAQGRRCQKVRWSMLLTVSGVSLEDVRVDRVEQDRSFPVRVRTEGDTARITDVRVDPGELCRGRTVTAEYRVAFAGDAASGEVRFEAQAFGRNNELLRSGSATTEVEGEEPEPSPSPSASESPEPEESEEAPIEEEAAVVPPSATDDPELSATAGQDDSPSLLGPGLIVGAVLVFLGVGLLLRIRMRNREASRRHRRPMPPPSFYPSR